MKASCASWRKAALSIKFIKSDFDSAGILTSYLLIILTVGSKTMRRERLFDRAGLAHEGDHPLHPFRA